jgi:nucleotide-binding universal stress UspA family protein
MLADWAQGAAHVPLSKGASMIQLEHILVPIDFSHFSDKALSYGCALAEQFDAQLHLLHVVSFPRDFAAMDWSAGYANRLPETYFQELEEAACRQLDETSFPETRRPLTAKREVREGTPFVEIVRYARQNEIDLIVIGTHGRTGIAHMLMGSVAEKVVRKAPCPVLAVRDPEHDFVLP